MKKLLYVAILLFAASCSEREGVQGAFEDIVKTSTGMALDTLHNMANEELKRQTGIDSLATKIQAADTINAEREVKRAIIESLSE